jgi:hypothetical protein
MTRFDPLSTRREYDAHAALAARAAGAPFSPPPAPGAPPPALAAHAAETLRIRRERWLAATFGPRAI